MEYAIPTYFGNLLKTNLKQDRIPIAFLENRKIFRQNWARETPAAGMLEVRKQSYDFSGERVAKGRARGIFYWCCDGKFGAQRNADK